MHNSTNDNGSRLLTGSPLASSISSSTSSSTSYSDQWPSYALTLQVGGSVSYGWAMSMRLIQLLPLSLTPFTSQCATVHSNFSMFHSATVSQRSIALNQPRHATAIICLSVLTSPNVLVEDWCQAVPCNIKALRVSLKWSGPHKTDDERCVDFKGRVNSANSRADYFLYLSSNTD